VISVLKQVFANQNSCLEESKSLIIESCSMENIHFQVVKFVCIYSCAFNHPRTIPKSKPSKSRHLRQTVSEFGEHISPQIKKQPIQRLCIQKKLQMYMCTQIM
jgi:hypothetical protein